MDIFELSNKLLTTNDKNHLESISGYSYENLIRDIENLDEKDLIEVFSSEKLIMNEELNRKGLHIYRILLTRRIEQQRRKNLNYNNHELLPEWEKNGIIVIPNFFEKDYYTQLKDMILEASNQNQQVNLNMASNNKFQDLIKITSTYPYPVNSIGLEIIDFDTFDKNEEQFNLHSDIFQPCTKIFYYVEDVNEGEGPFEFVPGSHRWEDPKLLKWAYDASLIAFNPSHKDYYKICVGILNEEEMQDSWGKTVTSTYSPRVGRGESDIILNNKLNDLELPNIKPMIAKGNTMIIANTSGFHRRGRATKPGVKRLLLRNGVRHNPFLI